MNTEYLLDAGQMFTLFFVMLGPFRFKDQYARVAMHIPENERKMFAVQTVLMSCAILILGGYFGSVLMDKWNITQPVLLLAGGVLFFVAALKHIIQPESDFAEFGQSVALKPDNVALRMIFTPYGLAAVIILISTSNTKLRLLTVLACLLAVMILNMLFMLYSKPGTGGEQSFVSKIFSPLLGTLQFALAIQMMVWGITNIEKGI